MKLPKAKIKIKRKFFQCRMNPKVKVWIKTRADERGMSIGEFIEEMFEPVMESEKCAKKKQTSTPRSKAG